MLMCMKRLSPCLPVRSPKAEAGAERRGNQQDIFAVTVHPNDWSSV